MSRLTDNVNSFARGSSRNKIIVTFSEISGMNAVDVGYHLAKYLQKAINKPNLSLKAAKYIDHIFENSMFQDERLRNVLHIKNIGILLEPELKLDYQSLIDKYSKSNVLIIHWDGIFQNHQLTYEGSNKYHINLSNLSYLIL